MKKIILTTSVFLFSMFSFGQLQRQMISSQGASSKTSSGVLVTQTIGQQSVTGKHISGKINVGSGYQQANWIQLVKASPKQVNIFPNPFSNVINIDIPDILKDSKVELYFFDVAGKMVFSKSLLFTGTRVIQNLELLSSGAYLVLMKNNETKYYTKLIKE